MLKKWMRGFTVLLLSASLSVMILAAAAVLSLGIYAAGLDTSLREDLFFATGDRTTRLFYREATGEFAELSSDRVSGYENALFCPLDEMPEALKNAFIAIEDKRFYQHGGIDWIRTASAVGDYMKGQGAHYGGSTITQQLIKNLTGDNERSARRKLTELIRAARLEQIMSKNEILEQYLNVVNLSQNCYGVRTAANVYFSKEPRELSLAECATLAAITQNPSRFDPIRHPEENLARRRVILEEMYRQGRIDGAALAAAKAEPLVLNVNGSARSGRVNSWFADLVITDVIRALVAERGMSEAAASRLVYSGGLKIYTTVDPVLQEAVERYYSDPGNFPTHEGGKKAQSAMMILDPQSGDVLAVAGAIGEKAGNRVQSYATDTKRPSGSVIKPLSVYAPALERGLITWSSVFDDVPRQFKSSGAPWPKNSPNLYRGLTNINAAVTHSVNTVSVAVLERLGIGTSYRFLTEELDMRSLDGARDTGTAALALGQQSEGVTLSELVGAYTALADGGVYHGTRSFYRVVDNRDVILLEREQTDRRVLEADNAAIMTMLLRQVTANGTAAGMQLTDRVNVAGKTGTSGNSCDKWFIGYTPELLAGVWYGFEYPESLADVKGNPALRIFDTLMSEAISLRPATKRHFDTGGDLVTVRYCRDSGKLMSEACYLDPRGDRSEIGYFKKGTEPTGYCDCHVKVRYCEHGGVATSQCPEEGCYTTALLRVSRRFPRQIKVLDAPYTYGGTVIEKERYLSYNEPYYAENDKIKQNYGIGIDVTPYNRICPMHTGGDDFWRRRQSAA